jgi:lipopolysaccharide export system permease protein
MIGPRLLDRYVLGGWLKLFTLTALGFPLVLILIELTDSLNKLLDRGLSVRTIATSYLYAVPENLSLIMPAAVLFATVFTIGSLGRHSELTAAKAGGMSFYRLALPIFLGATLASMLALVVGELAPESTARKLELQKARAVRPTSSRYNFVYRGDEGWVYTVRSLDANTRRLERLLLERQGNGADYPALVITADSATFDTLAGDWRLWSGSSRAIAAGDRQATFRFQQMRLRALKQTPEDLLAESKAPDEMRYAELGRYIEALKSSGNDTAKLEVEQALKIALPATCLVIALFGAPLAVTTHRSGAAVGIGISLATTVAFLLLAQISRAFGSGGAVDPVAAAWLPNGVFLIAALVLLARVRT